MNQIFHFLVIFIVFYLSTARSEAPLTYTCDDSSKTGADSHLSRNIDRLLPKLVQGAVNNGFLATSYGEGAERIYGLAQCRGDVGREDCSICIKDAANYSRNLCPTQTDVRVWYDHCFLKYSTSNFFGAVDTSYGLIFYNVQNVTEPDVFNQKLGALIDKIDSEAVRPANRGLGKGQSDLSEFLTLYALVQCTRDLSPMNCAQCLAIAIGNFPISCNNKKGCRVLYGSCYVRYELYPFYFPLDTQKSSNNIHGNYRSIKVYKP